MGAEINIEALLKTTIPKACVEEIDQLEKRIRKDGRPVYSKEYRAKKKELLRGQHHDKRDDLYENDNTYQPKGRLKFRYLLIAALLLVLSTATVMAYEPILEFMESIVCTIFPDRVEMKGKGNEETAKTGGFMIPSYIPEGYELISEITDDVLGTCYIIWEKEEATLSYSQFGVDTTSMTMTASENVMMDFMIGEYEGKGFADDKGVRTVFFENEACIYMVTGEESYEELIKMLEKLRYID